MKAPRVDRAGSVDRGEDGGAARTGRGVRVAVIDTGVDPAHPWLAGATLRHLRVVVENGKPRVVAATGGDASGHGTACAGIIHRMASDAEIVDIAVLDENGRCSRDGLLAAIRFCVVERFEVVNLSVGIDVPRGMPLRPSDHLPILDLYELADAAYTRGVVLVAAGPNLGTLRTYPGKFKSLIGVGRAAFVDREGLRTHVTADHEIVAPGERVVAPALGGATREWTGTSFATPHVAAHIARIRAENPAMGVEQIRAALHALAAAWGERERTTATQGHGGAREGGAGASAGAGESAGAGASAGANEVASADAGARGECGR